MSLTCGYCKESGHNKTNCWKLLGKNLAAQQKSAPTGCTVSMGSEVSSQAITHKDVEFENQGRL